MVKRFLDAGKSGFYLAVLREGEVEAGDEIKPLGRVADSVPVSDITRLYVAKTYDDADAQQVQRALRVDALTESWKQYFRDKLARLAG
jgi:MOSC domain-containing protein YiiM